MLAKDTSGVTHIDDLEALMLQLGELERRKAGGRGDDNLLDALLPGGVDGQTQRLIGVLGALFCKVHSISLRVFSVVSHV